MLGRFWRSASVLFGGLVLAPFLFFFGLLFAIPDMLRYRRIATM